MQPGYNLSALNPELYDLGARIAGAFYSPGNEDEAAKRLANNRAGLNTASPVATTPTVVGQPPPPPLSAAAVQGRAAETTAATPLDAPGFGASPPAAGNKVSIAEPAALPASAVRAATAPAPTGLSFAPRAPAAALDAELLGQRQLLLDQINAAQGVVSAGSNRDGYKMGDVTKSLATINALSPLVNSTSGLLGNLYGADARSADVVGMNATQQAVGDARNQTDLWRAQLAGQFGIEDRAAASQAAQQLAMQKSILDAISPQGQSAAAEAALKRQTFQDNILQTPEERIASRYAPSYETIKDGMGNAVGIRRNAAVAPFNPQDRVDLAPPQLKKN